MNLPPLDPPTPARQTKNLTATTESIEIPKKLTCASTIIEMLHQSHVFKYMASLDLSTVNDSPLELACVRSLIYRSSYDKTLNVNSSSRPLQAEFDKMRIVKQGLVMEQLLGGVPKFQLCTTKSVRCTSNTCGAVENVEKTFSGITIGSPDYIYIQATMDIYISEPHRNRHLCPSGCRINNYQLILTESSGKRDNMFPWCLGTLPGLERCLVILGFPGAGWGHNFAYFVPVCPMGSQGD